MILVCETKLGTRTDKSLKDLCEIIHLFRTHGNDPQPDPPATAGTELKPEADEHPFYSYTSASAFSLAA